MNNKQSVKKTNILKAALKVIPLLYRAAPILFIFSIIFTLCSSILATVNIFTRQVFFDSIEKLSDGKITIAQTITSLLIFTLTSVLVYVIHIGIATTLNNFVEKVSGKLTMDISKKASRIAPIGFEDTKLLNDINKANWGKTPLVWYGVVCLDIVSFTIPYFVGLSIYLVSVKPILILYVVLIFIPVTLSQIFKVKIFSKLEDKSSPVRREYEYYKKCITDREYFKETRILGGFTFFYDYVKDTLKLLNKMQFRANMNYLLTELCLRSLTVFGYSGILYILFNLLIKQEISIGAFVSIFYSLGQVYNVVEDLIKGQIGRLSQNVGLIQNYLSFLAIEERTGKNVEISYAGGIHLSDVSFKYPSAESYAIKNVNLDIKEKEMIAIVGENGSGKSTLVRLLLGLYLPTNGEIQYSDQNIKEVSMNSLFKKTSAVFQNFQKYKMSLLENIGISDTSKLKDIAHLKEVLRITGVNTDKNFLQGFETMLSREFGGVDLSGGEWQKIAIARGFFRDCEVIVLDEPTAAIDPNEEARMYEKFAEISKGKTSIVVTHRLGSARIADRIIVMSLGEIIESGTHEELLELNCEYAKMYAAQKQWYK